VLQQIYEGLVAWRSDGTVAPMLAKTIETSADRRT
jgi:peptide/nickel transport system substrate-binding protein